MSDKVRREGGSLGRDVEAETCRSELDWHVALGEKVFKDGRY